MSGSSEQYLQDGTIDLEELDPGAGTAAGMDLPAAMPRRPNAHPALTPTSIHSLLLLSDSALPLGSFAFSSGLESYIAHHRPLRGNTTAIHKFLVLSLESIASTALPYVLAAHRYPQELEKLDNDLDASTPCTVARRASIAQGRALLGIWERAFMSSDPNFVDNSESFGTLKAFRVALRRAKSEHSHLNPNGHLSVLWGIVSSAMGLPLHATAYIFLFKHVQSVLSAAVRASVLGPYQAQAVLASKRLQERILHAVDREWKRKLNEVGQVVPVMDLWIGRHEMLYSRIFNS